MKCFILPLCALVLFASTPNFAIERSLVPPQLSISLKPRQPNWRHEIIESYLNGQPKQVVFHEPLSKEGERPVKKIFFYEQGGVQSEFDLTIIDESEPGFAVWNSSVVPHGAKIDFSLQGNIVKVAQFDRGRLHGECRTLYPNGQLQSILHYEQDAIIGLAQLFYEDGQKKEEAPYVAGKLEGELVQYASNGVRISTLPHREGGIHGIAMEWYPSGALKSQRQFNQGMLHGDGKNPALVVYDEQRNLIEVCDFRNGQPIGLYIRYHQNGKESYRVAFKNGKKDGKEQSFAEDGFLLSEGIYQEGEPRGKHWSKHPNGQDAMIAIFDEMGTLTTPIREFNEKGICIRSWSKHGDRREGAYLEFYADGSPRVEYSFANDQFDGEQKEYFQNGQMKTHSFFKEGLRQGLHEEWNENGILACRIHFADNRKDGSMALWYPNGNCKMDAFFKKDQSDGILSEWHENGQLKRRFEYTEGAKDGWHREWNEEGYLLSEAFYEQEQLHGTVLVLWNQDQLRSRQRFEHGKKEGLQESFYENGQLERISNFNADQMEGECKAWYPDGSPRFVQYFKKNRPLGEHREYYQGNQLARLHYFDDKGLLHGEEKGYYLDGILQASLMYEHGVLHGEKKLFDPKGTLVEEAYYVRGKLEGPYFQRLPDGREAITHYKNNLKNGVHQLFFLPNAKGDKYIAIEANYEDDLLEALLIENNPEGKKVAETPYHEGKKEGLATFYDLKGKIAMTVEFHEDYRDGLTTHFFPSGTIYRETPYKKDLREGEERTYFETNQLASICHYSNDQLDGLSKSWNQEGILVFEGEYEKGLRHGKFNKYYDDGRPYLTQTFAFDLQEGRKHKYNQQGTETVAYYEAGKLIR